MVDMRLEGRDYVITIDKSGSMDEYVSAGYTRWEQGQEYVQSMAKFCNEFDPDGIKVITFNGAFNVYDNVTEEKVREVFSKERPSGGTNLAKALKAAFDDYRQRKADGETNNGEINVVLTDGEPSGGNNGRLAVMKAIAEFTQILDTDDEYGITFVQVGNDKRATNFLKALDDDLQAAGAKFDIVDTKTCDEIDEQGLSIEQILVAALDD